ncbi:GDP-L-fucose synthase [Alienimonas chondri]|uniref:GDP-L-fucose synthase n=1 Tax=Alienimonas chondri TaxID=2681879 RepID=A0ABX1VHY6_9PLAN|nr:GDP-L-fucose synthase [Alienimonas chondri]NNJ27424.1 GDP-L-fucose synthase [Alienimonas chondri]
MLVTGGAGFLGRHLCDLIRERDPAALIVPRSADCDLTEQADVRALFAKHRPEVVLHLAAEVGGIGANRENPGRYWYANAMMGLNLLEEARKGEVAKYVQVGTICSYPNLTPVPFREDALWDGYPEVTNAPYGVAKKSLIVGADAYRRQYGLSAISLLPVNLYGPHDNFDLQTSHVIPALIRKMVEAVDRGDDRVTAWGSGRASREFLFVRDAAEGILAATERYDPEPNEGELGGDPVNLGSGREITIRDLATLIAETVGFDGEIVWDDTKPDGQPRRCLDTTRAEQRFGWTANTDFRAGLAETVDWFRGHRSA